jgi:5-(carboxyamino)imidazole ribonucleotide synthase
MNLPLPPGSVLGVIGGGQLGMMTIREAHRMGYRTAVWDPDEACPASRIADTVITAPFTDADAASRLVDVSDAITYEFENVNVDLVRAMEERIRVRPNHAILNISQHRETEKRTLEDLGIPIVKFGFVSAPSEFLDVCNGLSYPLVVKTARAGYDGKGQTLLKKSEDAIAYGDALAAHPQEVVVEEFLDLFCELSVIAVRSDDGSIQEFPVVQNEHRDHILHMTEVPALVPEDVRLDALALGRRVIEGLDVVGVLCVEMFVTKDKRVLVNEIAPRPHNSGHYTLDTCSISQFEALVRIAVGLKVHEPELFLPCAMVNLLGKHITVLDVEALHAIPGTKLHLYGKVRVDSKRKMGHVTIAAETSDLVRERMNQVRSLIGEPTSQN